MKNGLLNLVCTVTATQQNLRLVVMYRRIYLWLKNKRLLDNEAWITEFGVMTI